MSINVSWETTIIALSIILALSAFWVMRRTEARMKEHYHRRLRKLEASIHRLEARLDNQDQEVLELSKSLTSLRHLASQQAAIDLLDQRMASQQRNDQIFQGMITSFPEEKLEKLNNILKDLKSFPSAQNPESRIGKLRQEVELSIDKTRAGLNALEAGENIPVKAPSNSEKTEDQQS